MGEPKRLAKLRTPENKQKMREKALKELEGGRPNLLLATRRPVICLETGERFWSVAAAAKYFGGGVANLSAHLHGGKWRKKFKGLHFKFLGDKHDHR